MKNKIILLILIGCFFSNIAFSEQQPRHYSLENVPYSIKKDIQCLHSSYDKIMENKEDKSRYEKQFIDCFPKTFDRFVLFFGYYYNLTSKLVFNDPDAYYDSSLIRRHKKDLSPYDYPELFINLMIEKEDYLTMFSLGVNGYYQADAVSYYVHIMSAFIEENPQITAETLNKMTPKDLDSFWYFYFEGWTFFKKFPKELLGLKPYSEKVFLSGQSMFEFVKQNYEK